jgi:hypothetical protein
MTEPSRRFPAPWRADKIPGGYVVRASTGQAVAWVYARETIAEAMQAKVLTKGRGAPDRHQHCAAARVAEGGRAVTISGAQVRAARGLLGWTVRDLARRAIVSIANVQTIQESQRLPSDVTAKLAALQETFEAVGIEFTDGDAPGVRLRPGAPKKRH